LNLYLLQRKPDEWRRSQTERRKKLDDIKASVSPTSKESKESSGELAPQRSSVAEPASSQLKKKRKRQEDEIDALFSSSFGKKTKKGTLDSEPAIKDTESRGFVAVDKDLKFSA